MNKTKNFSEYQRQYRETNPVYVEYYRILNQVRHICMRIRDESLGLRSSSLKNVDKEFKGSLEKKFKDGMTWQNYGTTWYLKCDDIINKLKNGYSSEQLTSPKHFFVDFKRTTNNSDKNN